MLIIVLACSKHYKFFKNDKIGIFVLLAEDFIINFAHKKMSAVRIYRYPKHLSKNKDEMCLVK